MIHVILVRHGQSVWNEKNLFTGWMDVELTPKGEAEAKAAGHLLQQAGYKVDTCFVSPLKRAQQTARLMAEAMGTSFQMRETPEIIERFYGELTGLDKAATAEKYGDEQVHIWRRSYDIPPPAYPDDHQNHPRNNPAWQGFPFELRGTESLKDVVERITPFCNTILRAAMQPGQTVLVVAHGNSNRAIIKKEAGLTDEEVIKLELPTGVPVVMDYTDAGDFQNYRFLNPTAH